MTEDVKLPLRTLLWANKPKDAVRTLLSGTLPPCRGVKHLGTTRRADRGSDEDKGLTVGHRFFKFFTFFKGGVQTLSQIHTDVCNPWRKKRGV